MKTSQHKNSESAIGKSMNGIRKQTGNNERYNGTRNLLTKNQWGRTGGMNGTAEAHQRGNEGIQWSDGNRQRKEDEDTNDKVITNGRTKIAVDHQVQKTTSTRNTAIYIGSKTKDEKDQHRKQEKGNQKKTNKKKQKTRKKCRRNG